MHTAPSPSTPVQSSTPRSLSPKALIKSAFRRLAPRVLELIQIYRTRRQHAAEHVGFQNEMHQRLFHGGDITVSTGPFKGMRYFNIATWGSIVPQWLGSYECDLHEVFAGIGAHDYDTVIDVGCAAGYYVAGLARRLPQSRVFAFDIDPWSQRHARRLAELNDVGERVTISGRCSHATLQRIISGRTLVVCDIEGAEEFLLDPSAVPKLRDCDLLVEMHEVGNEYGLAPANRDREQLIRQRFASHRVTVIAASDCSSWCAQHRGLLPDDILARCADEKRAPGMNWLWLRRV